MPGSPCQQHDLWQSLWSIWTISPPSLEQLRLKVRDLEAQSVRHGDQGQPCLWNQTPGKSLDTKLQVGVPGWQYSMHIITHDWWEKFTLSVWLCWRGPQDALHLVSPGPCPYASLPIADLSLRPFIVINRNCECNSFIEFSEFFPWILVQGKRGDHLCSKSRELC